MTRNRDCLLSQMGGSFVTVVLLALLLLGMGLGCVALEASPVPVAG